MADPFDILDEIAAVLRPETWMVVGGLMVHAHSELAGLPNPRTTDDADLVVEVGVVGYADAAQALQSIGFSPHDSIDHQEPSYRFDRDSDHVDLMVPDRTTGVRFRRRPVLAVPGAGSAIKRTQPFRLRSDVEVRIPDLPSALSLKGAAWRTASLDPSRHIRDGVTLFACADGREDLIPPSKSMHTNINYLLNGLNHEPELWRTIPLALVQHATRGIRQHYRAEWNPPAQTDPQRYRPPR